MIQRFLIGQAARRHRIEDEIGRAIDDAHHLGDAVTRKRFAQAVNDGNCARNRGLVVEVCAGFSRSGKQLWTVSSKKRLVAGHHGNALFECSDDIGSGWLNTADQFNDNIVAIDCFFGMGRQKCRIHIVVTRRIKPADRHLVHAYTRT